MHRELISLLNQTKIKSGILEAPIVTTSDTSNAGSMRTMNVKLIKAYSLDIDTLCVLFEPENISCFH